MTKKLLFFLLLIYSSFHLESCCKEACYGGDVAVSFQNYTLQEVDTVIFVGTSGNIKDSFAVITPSSGLDMAKSPLVQTVHPQRRWTVTMPSVNKVFRFDNFEFEKQKCACSNSKMEVLKSYTVDGVPETSWFYVLPR